MHRKGMEASIRLVVIIVIGPAVAASVIVMANSSFRAFFGGAEDNIISEGDANKCEQMCFTCCMEKDESECPSSKMKKEGCLVCNC